MPESCEYSRERAESVTKVEFEVAVMLLAVPVVFWFSVGKFEGTAAAIEVPFPYKIPVTLVDNVSTGVVVGLETVPENPFAVATEIVVTVPLPAIGGH